MPQWRHLMPYRSISEAEKREVIKYNEDPYLLKDKSDIFRRESGCAHCIPEPKSALDIRMYKYYKDCSLYH